MARLIDADKIDYTVTMVGMDENAGYCAVAFESDIDDMPTVDAVEVVRCKDCKNYCAEYCVRDIKGRTNMFYMPADAFCSYGEKKVSE